MATDDLNDMSSPGDNNIGMKKRMNAMKAAKEAKEAEPKVAMSMGECDLGMSPEMSRGAIWRKKQGGGGTTSPLS